METLLPSEIAKLVYGYLIGEKCDSAAQLFLESSDHLKECNAAFRKGRRFNTRVFGLCLVDILNLYCDAVCMLKNYKDKRLVSSDDGVNNGSETLIAELGSVLKELENVLLVNDNTEQNKQKTVFFRISIPPKRKTSGSNGSPEKMDSPKKDTTGKEKEKKKDLPVADESFDSTVLAKTVSSSLDDFDINMLQTLLDNTTLHERIAENINKAIDSSGEIPSSGTKEKEIVETVLHSTEADPIFEELLHMLAVPRTEDTTTPEDTDKENGDPTEETRPVDSSTSQVSDQEAMKRLEADNNMAIEGILAGNKKAQEQTVILPQPVCSNPQVAPVTSVVLSSPVEAGPVTSTPLQPLRGTNIPTIIGMISPVPGQKMLVPVQSLPKGMRGFLRGAGRHKRILPKPDNMSQPVLRLQVQSEGSDTPQIIHAVPAAPCPDILKKPRARTRGGLQRRGTRGVKSIAPQITTLDDSNVNVVFVETKTSIKTRSMSKVESKFNDTSLDQRRTESRLEVIPEQPESLEKSSFNQDSNLVSDYSCPDKTGSNGKLDKSNSPLEAQKMLLTAGNCVPDSQEELQKLLPLVEANKGSLPDLNSPNILNKEIQAPILVQNLPQELRELVHVSEISGVKGCQVGPGEDETSTSGATVIEKGELDSSIHQEGKDIGEEGTPEQQTVLTKVKKRVSLSTPRRGTHIRALDFKTPEKPLAGRKSLTSPKAYTKVSLKNDVTFDRAKRGILNSPDTSCSTKDVKMNPDAAKEIKKSASSEVKKVGSKKIDWDSDLRKFMDIPTSVGLKRKTMLKKEPKKQPKNKAVRRKFLKKNAKKECDDKIPDSNSTLSCAHTSNEDISTQIEKNIKDALVEEVVNSCPEDTSKLKTTGKGNRSCTSSCSENMVIDEQENNSPSQPPVVTLNPDFGNNCSSSQEENLIPAKMPSTDISESIFRPDSPGVITDDVGTTGANVRDLSSIPSEDMPTPVKESDSSLKVDTIGQMTPVSKFILGQIHFSPNSNSQSYSTLESILISEGSRLEQEKALQTANGGSINLPDPVEVESAFTNVKPQSTYKKPPIVSEESRRHIPVECVVKQSIVQTPAKSLTAQLPASFPVEATPLGKVLPGFPVEMTPLSKALHSETKFLSTSLVTPTLPPTPKVRDDESPDNSDCSESSKDEKNESPQNNAQSMPATGKENIIAIEPIADIAEGIESTQSMPFAGKENNIIKPKTVTAGDIESSNVEVSVINLDNQKSTGTVELGIPSVSARKISDKTPRIKLSPKKKKKMFGVSRLKKTPVKRKIRRILSSSDTSEDEIPLGNITPLVSSKKVSPDPGNSKAKLLVSSKKVSPDSGNSKTKLLMGTTSGKVLTLTPKQKKLKNDSCKTVKKQTKLSPNKKETQSDLSLLKQEEECLKELLKECQEKSKANAIFGLISSDSDSSDDNAIEIIKAPEPDPPKRKSALPKPLKPTLMSAHERLKNLKTVSMLYSSSSSENENDNLFPPEKCNFGIPKKDLISMRNTTKSATSFSDGLLEVATNVNTHPAGISDIKKLDSPKKLDKPFKEIGKTIGRERDESCESFPALYLSEESNMSVVSESHGGKMVKFRKSPSAGSDMHHLKKGTISSTSGGAALRANIEKQSSSKQMTSHSKQQNFKSPPTSPKCQSPDNGTTNSPDTYRTFIHKTSDSLQVTSISVQESQAMSKYLDNYTYSFIFDEEGGNNVLTKTLKTSPLFTIFDMNSNQRRRLQVRRERGSSPDQTLSQRSLILQPNRLKKSPIGKSPASPSRAERQASPDLTKSDRNKSPLNSARKPSTSKRPERYRAEVAAKSGKVDSHSVSLREERNRSPAPRSERRLSPSPQRDRPRKRHRSQSCSDDDRRKHPRYEGGTRRDYRNIRDQFRRNNFYNKRPKFYSAPRYENKSRFHDRHERFHAMRHSVQDSVKRSHKRSSNDHGDQSSHSSKSYNFEKRYNLNDTFRSSKSSESDRLIMDQSFKSSDHPESTLDTKKKNERSHHSISECVLKKKLVPNSDLEEGELSDASEFHPNVASSSDAATEAKRKKLIALMSDNSRAKLLNSVDLDRFLTMLHGAEKEDK